MGESVWTIGLRSNKCMSTLASHPMILKSNKQTMDKWTVEVVLCRLHDVMISPEAKYHGDDVYQHFASI